MAVSGGGSQIMIDKVLRVVWRECCWDPITMRGTGNVGAGKRADTGDGAKRVPPRVQHSAILSKPGSKNTIRRCRRSTSRSTIYCNCGWPPLPLMWAGCRKSPKTSTASVPNLGRRSDRRDTRVIAGRPDGAISVALVEACRPVVAALHAPMREELFLAIAGGGATRNRRRDRTCADRGPQRLSRPPCRGGPGLYDSP